MHETVIDNPDLHLSIEVEQTTLKTVLDEILDSDLTIITDLAAFDFTKKQLNHWVHHYASDDVCCPTTLSVYNIKITIENAIQLASTLNCEIVTDFDPQLNQHQWQLIRPDGTITVVDDDVLFNKGQFCF